MSGIEIFYSGIIVVSVAVVAFIFVGMIAIICVNMSDWRNW